MIVADSNILAAYVIAGEQTADANALRSQDAEWMVPVFWRIEFQSILWKFVRFGGMPADKALDVLDDALDLFSANEIAMQPDVVLRDAIRRGITVYDAQYASLAKQLGIPLVTVDEKLQKACPGLAVPLTAFVQRPPRRNTLREAGNPYGKRRK